MSYASMAVVIFLMLQVNLQPDYSIRLAPPMPKLGQENLSKLEDESHVDLNAEDFAKLGKQELSKTDLIFSANGLRSPRVLVGLYRDCHRTHYSNECRSSSRMQISSSSSRRACRPWCTNRSYHLAHWCSCARVLIIRFVIGVDINSAVQTALAASICTQHFAWNLAYAFVVTMLWSVGINGDNAMDAIVAPIVFQYLGANVEAVTHGQPLPTSPRTGFSARSLM